jgi:hypothetical protein
VTQIYNKTFRHKERHVNIRKFCRYRERDVGLQKDACIGKVMGAEKSNVGIQKGM